MKKNKNILLLAVAAVGGYFAYKKFSKKEEPKPSPSPVDVGKPLETKHKAIPEGGTSVSLPPVAPVSPSPVTPSVETSPVVLSVPTPKGGLIARIKKPLGYGTGTGTPVWTTTSPTSNFSYTSPATGSAANVYNLTGFKPRRKRKPKFCI